METTRIQPDPDHSANSRLWRPPSALGAASVVVEAWHGVLSGELAHPGLQIGHLGSDLGVRGQAGTVVLQTLTWGRAGKDQIADTGLQLHFDSDPDVSKTMMKYILFIFPTCRCMS